MPQANGDDAKESPDEWHRTKLHAVSALTRNQLAPLANANAIPSEGEASGPLRLAMRSGSIIYGFFILLTLLFGCDSDLM